MSNPKLIIEVAGDNRPLKRALRDSETQMSRFGRKLDAVGSGAALGRGGGLGSAAGLAKGGGIALGAGIAAQKLNELTQAASDLNEQQTKSQAVFGASAQSIADWSDTTSKALGISKRAALEASGTFGNLFHTVGIGAAPAAEMSQRLVQLASDLASFNNADPSEVLDAIRSGLIGEAEPMRRFGALLSETRVQQQAMSDTGKRNAKALTDQEKAVARYEIILSDTTQAQGDFARTADGLANKQRTLAARSEDLKGKLGTGLLPVMDRLVTTLSDGVDLASQFADGLGKLNDRTDGFAGKFLDKATTAPWGEMSAFVKVLASGHVVAFGEAPSQTLETLNNVKAINDALTQTPALAASWSRQFGLGALTALGPPAPPVPGTTTTAPRKGATVDQRNNWFDSQISRELDRVQDVKTVSGQVSALQAIAGEIQKRIDATKDITRRLNLEDQLAAVQRRATALQVGAAQDAATAAAELAAKEKERLQRLREAATARRQSRQFQAIGLGPDGGAVVPRVANLQTQLRQLTSRADIDSLSSPLKKRLDGVAKVLRGGFGKVTSETRSAIQALFDTIRDELNQGASGGPLTKTTQLSDRILAGLGLSPKDAAELKARIANFNSAGTALAGTGTASSVNLTSHTVIDGRVVATTSSKYQRRARTVNTAQRNGPNAGGYVGA